METVLELQKLTKRYGQNRGVEALELTVRRGSIMGFLGPNGAGKSTTINVLLQFMRPSSGSARILGKDIRQNDASIRRDIGFLSSDMALDGSLSGWQQLVYYGNLRGSFDRDYVKELAMRLDCNLGRRIKTLSRGNRQKVGLISALMHKPALLILDEPTSGLDPLIQAEFNKIILEHKAAGRTAFISSHVLSEVQEICDEVAFIRQGKLVAVRDLRDVSAQGEKIITVQTDDKGLVAKLKKLARVEETGDSHLRFTYKGSLEPLLKLLARSNLRDLTITDINLEDTFMSYYEDDNGAADA